MKCWRSGCMALVIFILRCRLMAGNNILPSIYWSTTNPLFKSSQTYLLNVLPSTRVSIICPIQALIFSPLQSELSVDQLYENILMVDKDGFENCLYDSNRTSSHVILKCDDPNNLKQENLVFSAFKPDGIEYKPGQDYYFIATSDGSRASLTSTSGGHCNDSNKNLRMKLQVHVCTTSTDCEQRNLEKSNFTEIPSTGAPVVINPTGGKRSADGSETSVWMPIAVVLVVVVLILVILASLFLWKFSNRMKKNEESSKQMVEAVNTIARNRDSQLMETLSQGSFNIHDHRSVSMYVSDQNMNGTLEKSDYRPPSIISSPSQFFIPPNIRESQYTTNSAAGLLPYTSPKTIEV